MATGARPKHKVPMQLLACIAHKLLDQPATLPRSDAGGGICERCRLRQRNIPAPPDHSAAFWSEDFKDSLLAKLRMMPYSVEVESGGGYRQCIPLAPASAKDRLAKSARARSNSATCVFRTRKVIAI